MPSFETLGVLKQLGYEGPNAVRQFQAARGLSVDGEAGPITLRHLRNDFRVCGVPDHNPNKPRIQLGQQRVCRIGDNHPWNGRSWTGTPTKVKVRWALAPGVSSSLVPSLQYGWDVWMEHCALDARQAQRGESPNVVYTYQRIDGSSGTLAWAELPCGRDRQYESRMDSTESWHLDPFTPPSRGRIHLGAVMAHENGHLLGLEHRTDGGSALLEPTYSPRVRKPIEWDINQAVFRYGPASDVPEPDPNPPADPDPVDPDSETYIVVNLPKGLAPGTHRFVLDEK